MTLAPKPTGDEIRAYRDLRECGMKEAKDALYRLRRCTELRRLKVESGGAMRPTNDILRDLIELMLESEQ